MKYKTELIDQRAVLVAAGWKEKWQSEVVTNIYDESPAWYVCEVVSGWMAPRGYGWSVLLVEGYALGRQRYCRIPDDIHNMVKYPLITSHCYIHERSYVPILTAIDLTSKRPLTEDEERAVRAKLAAYIAANPHTLLSGAFAAYLDETADAP
jgi:hypothetical protein